MTEYERLQSFLSRVRETTDFIPRVALVLGSGLGELANEMEVVSSVNYSDIDGFPISTVSGHAGKFLFGKLGGADTVIMSGRVHYYEGYKMNDVVAPIRLMRMLGAQKLILTNAAGAINKSFSPGDIMLITGHISSFIPSPLIGENIEELGERFPDMSSVYDPFLAEIARSSIEKEKLREGIYLQATGPQYETPEEIRMYRILGADAVGMSTVCEAIAARHAGMSVLGLSLITNMASGVSDIPLSHLEVKASALNSAPKFRHLIKEILSELNKNACR